MNALNADTIAKLELALKIARGGLPWEFCRNSIWYPGKDPGDIMAVLNMGWEIRIKQTAPIYFARPPYPATLHNPDNLTPEQVGEGYRLLLPEEVDGRHALKAAFYHREINGWARLEDDRVNERHRTYRVPITIPWPERADPLAEVKAAHARGDAVQFRWTDIKNHEWTDWLPSELVAESALMEWRVKPATEWTPKYAIGQRVALGRSRKGTVEVISWISKVLGVRWDDGALTYVCVEELEPIPWTLPTPPAGFEHHRNDFTEEMLKDGGRPLCKGEPIQTGDSYSFCGGWQTVKIGLVGNTPEQWEANFWKTTRPYPAAKTPAKKVVQPSADDMRKAQWLRPKDTTLDYAIVMVLDGGETFATAVKLNEESVFTLSKLYRDGWSWSADRVTWNPCEKEVEA